MKVLIVGLGSIAKRHIASLRSLDKHVQIYALRRSRDGNSIKDVMDVYSMDSLPPDLDFCIVSTPTALHIETIHRLIPLQLPLFIEKPVSADLDNAEGTLKAISENNILTYTACNLRFHPSIQFLKEEFSRRIPIEITAYCGSFLPDWRPDQDYRDSYSSRKELGGGVHLDLIHEIDYCRFLLGNPITASAVISKKSNLRIETADVAHYTLEYPDTMVFLTLNYYRKDPKRSLECIWEDGTWEVDLLLNKITNERNEIIFEEPFSIDDTYFEQMRYFTTCLAEFKQPMNSIHEGFETLKLSLNETV